MLPLHIFEDRYRALVRHLVGLPEGTPREFGVVAIRAGWEVGPTAPDGRPLPGDDVTLHEVGCTAELRQVTELPDGGYDIVTVGRRRFRMGTVDRASAPYLTAEVEWLPEPDAPDEAAELPAARVIAVFRQYLGLIRADPAEIPEQLPEDPTVLSHLVAATAALTIADRQRLLAIDDTAARLRAELRLLNREAALLRQVRAVPVPLKELAAPPTPN
ncbi:peptidase [Salinispora arenicola]|uniref:Peptidase n=1 Tax=Salinispora arenicola TaxID=168697 RepID=A0ABQ4JT52_SALAC|nr:peptidase [Salinispora arenicola]